MIKIVFHIFFMSCLYLMSWDDGHFEGMLTIDYHQQLYCLLLETAFHIDVFSLVVISQVFIFYIQLKIHIVTLTA